MTFKTLAAKISKAEGKRHRATFGDVCEILRLVSVEIVTDPRALVVLLANGLKHTLGKRPSKS